MEINVQFWKYVRDYPGAQLNMTSSAMTASISASYHMNFDHVDVTAQLEVTNSIANTKNLITYTFKNLPVVSYWEYQSGSVFRQLVQVQRPNIHMDKLQADGITLKLRDITKINFDTAGVEYYLNFAPQTPPWRPYDWR